MAKVKISVMRQDIIKGSIGDGTLCAVARAARRAGFTKVHVDDSTLHGNYKKQYCKIDLPTTAKRFITRFDATDNKTQRKALKPFTFNVTL